MSEALRVGRITIDPAAHGALLDGRALALTATEFRLLVALVRGAGRVQSRTRLLRVVWNAHPDIQTRTVDMHVQRLRRKLGEAASVIETVRGSGYRLRRAGSGA